MEKIKLNLGCGLDIRKGWVNLDAIKTKGVDVIHNLNKYPYPFKDDTFDEIFASHIIEHLPDTVSFIKEIWRISKPNAKIIIKTDHYSGGSLGWGDPEHLEKFFYLNGCWINEINYFVFFPLCLPTDHYQIWKNFNIKENKSISRICARV